MFQRPGASHLAAQHDQQQRAFEKTSAAICSCSSPAATFGELGWTKGLDEFTGHVADEKAPRFHK